MNISPWFKKNNFDFFIIFFISLSCISLELFFTRILNLKTWNHVVYVIIPYAMLGYGIGAILYLSFKEMIDKYQKDSIISITLLFLSGITIFTTISLILLPIRIENVVNFLTNFEAIVNLLIAYTIFMLPFVVIGFLTVYLFSTNPLISNQLYFLDLAGAGFGAAIFFFLINWTGVFHSISLLSSVMLSIFLLFTLKKRRLYIPIAFLFCSVLLIPSIPELDNYVIDPAKGWEWIPGFIKKGCYKKIVSKWHPFGRTDIYQLDRAVQEYIYPMALGTFEINLIPPPDFSYITTDFLAGTPIYNLSLSGLNKYGSQIELFSQAMECPYILLNYPRVVVIGVGGGRDVFMAKTHGAIEIIGAEINPVTYNELSARGTFHDYSGRVYTQNGINILNVDGRHLVKKLKPNYYDLIILNGVDTFTGLSTGAYAYAESYLYTKNAVIDYLHILNKNGIVYFNRWFEQDIPRESLRLFAIILDALKSTAVDKPWNHVIIGAHYGWSLILVKKNPFTAEERQLINKYFQDHNVSLIFPTENWEIGNAASNYFDSYAQSFIDKKESVFKYVYPYDISVITDDNPFFYKYYKFKSFNPLNITWFHHIGTTIYMTQFLVLSQSIFFIILFIMLPLFIFKRTAIKKLPKRYTIPFVLFFGCIGIGFMFIEISLMQKFVLLLGSPIYSISVTLTALLIFSGLGSFLLGYFKKYTRTNSLLLQFISILMAIYLISLILIGTYIQNYFISLSFIWRILIVCIILFPLGIFMGMFFPSGLQLIGKNHKEIIPWAWGINCGFSVLGSTLSIILAQFYGFNLILFLAILTYLIAGLAFKGVEHNL